MTGINRVRNGVERPLREGEEEDGHLQHVHPHGDGVEEESAVPEEGVGHPALWGMPKLLWKEEGDHLNLVRLLDGQTVEQTVEQLKRKAEDRRGGGRLT